MHPTDLRDTPSPSPNPGRVDPSPTRSGFDTARDGCGEAAGPDASVAGGERRSGSDRSDDELVGLDGPGP